MHMHFIVGAVLHATAIAVLGFFVLFAASKASGIVKLAGTLLGWWLWILAVLAIVCAVVCPNMGDKPWMGHMGMRGSPPPDAMAAPAKPDAAPAQAAPAAPPPKKP
jgi:hypothetical protein